MIFSRRSVVIGAAVSGMAAAPDQADAWRFEFPSIDEGQVRFADYRGKVLLVVNTASFCAYTPQYKQLELLHRDLGARGLVVIGVPSQDFGQEQDSNAQVKTFCELTYGVDFPMAAISKVSGPGAAPFYRWVCEQRQWEPRWNFFKVLIGRDGGIAGTFTSSDAPDRGSLRAALEAALSRA